MLPAVSCLGVAGGSPTHTQVCREVRVETTDVWRMTHGAGGKGRSPPTTAQRNLMSLCNSHLSVSTSVQEQQGSRNPTLWLWAWNVP